MADMEALRALMARLRDPEDGCPWDRQQTFDTIVPYTIEEAYEVADAVRSGDMAGLRDELGDLLFQVVFHARMAEEAGVFDLGDVVAAIVDKMTRRHPHVFGDEAVASAEEQTRRWEAHKAAERRQAGEGGRLAGVSPGLPGLTRAVKLQRRAARAGFDWSGPGPAADKVAEELDEVRAELAAAEPDPAAVEAEVGDLMLACAALARHAGVDPEAALRHANAKFEHRFAHMEASLETEGRAPEEVGPEEFGRLWQRAKQE